ncbi:MAG TPA: tyrosine-type recombinase/integrase [Terracidiphilus sp.]|nr:tyrosine-type recombinase/integrase [Terracidiphilus sp.]
MPVREVRPPVIDRWFKKLDLAPSTKASIRSVLSVCFTLAALHEFIPATEKNPMTLIKLKGVSKRSKKISEVTVEQFQAIYRALPEPLNVMLLVDGVLGLRISELLAMKWEDIDEKAKTVVIRRKFMRGQLGKTKAEGSEAALPIADPLLSVRQEWKTKTNRSEWVFLTQSERLYLPTSLAVVCRSLGRDLVAVVSAPTRCNCHVALARLNTPCRLLLELKRVTSPLRLRHLSYPFALEQLAKGYVLRGQGQQAGCSGGN